VRNGNLRTAFKTIRAARWRSILTMSGIIIGVLAVITTVSIGQGVTQQITGQVAQFKKNIITISPGGQDKTSVNNILNTGSLSSTSLGSLSDNDIKTALGTPGVRKVVPLGVGSGFASVNGQRLAGSVVLATTDGLPVVLNHPVEFGNFFTSDELERPAVVIGQSVALQLFEEQSPIGRTLQIRGQDFIVRGVFADFNQGFLSLGVDLNKAVFIPYPAAQTMANGSVPITQAFVEADSAKDVSTVTGALRQRLAEAHGGQADFTVLAANDQLQHNSQTVQLLTQMVTGVAAIVLLVGGLGIVNIMLVSVTERTREIGIRKAVGATNRQILSQFLFEAAILSVIGAFIGVILALLLNLFLKLGTNLNPKLSIPVLIVTPAIAWLLGMVFGILPAIRAARKDPIEALRYE
jgi:putative ABC transport system permease protein